MIGMESLGAMTNGQDLDHNPHTGLKPLVTLKADVALLSMILLGHGMTEHFR